MPCVCCIFLISPLIFLEYKKSKQSPVVQSMVSLMSSFVVKMLTVLVNTISNSQVFLLKKISIYAIFNDTRFNNTLTNGIVSFEQLGPSLEKLSPL